MEARPVADFFARVTILAHEMMSRVLELGDCAIDATVGTGQDTVFLAKLVGPNGSVVGFDIQEDAIQKSRFRLQKEGLNNVILYQDDHQHLDRHNYEKMPKLIVFNLGYLPGGDHSLVTTPSTTATALDKAVTLLMPGGLLIVVVYPGHPGGEAESVAVKDFLSNLPKNRYDVVQLCHLNRADTSPYLLVCQKKP